MIKIISSKNRAEIKRIQDRGRADLREAIKVAQPIISDVIARGDKAIFEYTKKFDKKEIGELKVSKQEIKDAYKKVSKALIEAIKISANNIRKYHELQMPKEWSKEITKGVKAGQLLRPLDSVGCYVPGGKYPLVSTVIMTVVPAMVAGVNEIILCSPPEINPVILVAADICGVAAIYKVGGAQAIAAMAYGTETIPKVNKIVGPGNIYVTAAKKAVYGDVGIDFIAGPSEVMIVADDKSNARFIAADMLSQAEHDRTASSILITDCKTLAEEVKKEIEKQLKDLPSKETTRFSIENYGAIILAKNINEAFDIVNEFAPEHLEIMSDDESLLKKVKNAGAVFLGQYSVEAAGDYASGPNHVLPTSQFAKVRAGLGALDFVKMPTIQKLSKEGLKSLSKTIKTLADAEGLIAHKRSIEVREKE